MFGAYFYGQSFYGASQAEQITIRPNAGGMFGSATFGQSYYGQQLYFGETPAPVPPTPPKPVGGGGGGGGVSDRRGKVRRALFAPAPEPKYETIKFPNLVTVFETEIKDISGSKSEIRADVIKSSRGKRPVAPRFYGIVAGVAERSSSSKSTQFFKGAAHGVVSSVGFSKSISESSENNLGIPVWTAKTRSKSSFYGFANPLVEIGSKEHVRKTSFYGWAEGESMVEFTPDQEALLTLIAQDTFFNE